MPDFKYKAKELSGKEVTGLLTAANENEVISSLAGRSLFPTQIVLSEPKGSLGIRKVGKRVASRHLSAFYSQLADLLHSGVPLLRSLEILEHQASSPSLQVVLQSIREQVADGVRLADAMQQHARVFHELGISMVKAGEEGGFLEDVLKRIANFTDHQEELKGRVVGALVYPLFLMSAGICVVVGMLVFFVPKFAPIFDRLSARGQLPMPTRILMGLSHFLQHYGLWVVLLVGAAVWWAIRALKTPQGRLFADTWRLKLKGIGPIVRSLAIARFCRILGTLLKNGVPILPSLKISKDATGNKLLSDAIAAATENISAGKSLANPLAASGEFSREIVEMIAVGEEANNLEQVLLNIADNLEHRTHRQLDLFVRLLEPLMLLVMAGLILFVIVALLMPVFQGAGAMN